MMAVDLAAGRSDSRLERLYTSRTGSVPNDVHAVMADQTNKLTVHTRNSHPTPEATALATVD